MLNLNNLKAGRIYSFKHIGDIETVGFHKTPMGRENAPDWLKASHITREASFKGNLATVETYAHVMLKQDPTWEPTGKPVWWEWVQAGIVKHKKTGQLYLALVNPTRIKSVYFVNGVEATPEQTATIKEWKKGNGDESDFALYSLEKVEYTGGIESNE